LRPAVMPAAIKPAGAMTPPGIGCQGWVTDAKLAEDAEVAAEAVHHHPLAAVGGIRDHKTAERLTRTLLARLKLDLL
jgi:hypothetical protein